MAILYLKDGIVENWAAKDPEKLKTRIILVAGAAADIIKTFNKGYVFFNGTLDSGKAVGINMANILAVYDTPEQVPVEEETTKVT